MRPSLLAASLFLGCAVGGCRATVTPPDMTQDLGGDDLAGEDLGPPDLYGADLLCETTGPENCTNGCDDDRNGHADDDDPACTPQVLVVGHGTMKLERFIFGATPQRVVFDGNTFAPGSAVYQKAFSVAAFRVEDTVGNTLHRITPPDGGATGVYTTYAASHSTRDVCIFNGELIVVERDSIQPSRLHRLMPDGQTEIGVVNLGATVATACASDGNRLYVSVHDTVPGNKSQFLVFDKTFTAVLGSPYPMHASLTDPPPAGAGYDRCLDLAWAPKSGSFYGLFATSTDFAQPFNDQQHFAKQIHPFQFDGGVGSPQVLPDGGFLHGIGEFLP